MESLRGSNVARRHAAGELSCVNTEISRRFTRRASH
jgi:hypothetical protein